MSKQNKEVLLQTIYDSGIESTCKQWSLTEEEISNILYPEDKPAPKIRKVGVKPIKLNKKVSAIIEKNYSKLWSKYVTDKTKLSMCQTSEDVFHNTLLKVIEELSVIDEEQVLDYIEYRLKMVNFQIKQDQKELYKHQIYLEDAISQESTQTSE